MIKQVFFFNYQTAEGLNFSSANTPYLGYSFSGGMWMLLLDIVIYTILGLYLDQVVPSQFGVAKPWNFCCKKSVKRRVADEEVGLLGQVAKLNDPKNFEPVADSLKRQEQSKECLQVRGLVKKFGEKTAVNGTSLTMYNG